MNKIPFSRELYEKGYPAVYRDGTPAKVIFFEDGTPVSKNKDGNVFNHTNRGLANNDKFDLFLLEPVKWFVITDKKEIFITDSPNKCLMIDYEVWEARPYKHSEK